MTKTHFLLTAVAAAALAGCDNSDQNLVQGAPGNAAATAGAAAPVVLPPSIVSSKIYRCKDNAVVYIDWLSDSKSANLRTDKNGDPTVLTTAEAGGAMVAEGYSLIGLPTATTVTLERPGKGSQACKA